MLSSEMLVNSMTNALLTKTSPKYEIMLGMSILEMLEFFYILKVFILIDFHFWIALALAIFEFSIF